MTLSDADVQRIAKAVADVLDERKEQRRVEQARYEVELRCQRCSESVTFGTHCGPCLYHMQQEGG